MAISNRKLGYGKGGVNLISLYDDIKDVGGTGFPVKIDGKILYAKIGDVKHQQASAIKVGKGGVKCLLFRASVVWNLKDGKEFVDNNGWDISRYSSGTGISLKARYQDKDGKWLGSTVDTCTISFEFDIPKTAKNIKFSCSYCCSFAGTFYDIKHYVNGDWRNPTTPQLLEISGNKAYRYTVEGGSEYEWFDESNGHFILPNKYKTGKVSRMLGAGWNGFTFDIGCGGGDFADQIKNFSISDIKIEFEES